MLPTQRTSNQPEVRATMQLLAVLIALASAVPALAQDGDSECRRMLHATREAARHYVYDVTGADYDWVAVRTQAALSPHRLPAHATELGAIPVLPPVNPDTYRDAVGFRHSGRAMGSLIESWRCDGETLLLESIVYGASHPGERFDPPVPWLTFPLVEGAEWTWTGTWSVEIFGGSAEYPAHLRFRVLPRETVDLLPGRFDAQPLRIEMTFAGESEPSRIETHWILTRPTFQTVMRRVELAGLDEPVEEWRIIYLESGSTARRGAVRSDQDEAEMGYLGVSSSPAGGVVHVDGAEIGGTTPLRQYPLPVGRYEVRVFYPDADRFSDIKHAVIRPGLGTNLFFVLDDAPTPETDVDRDHP